MEHFNLTSESSEVNMHKEVAALVASFKGDAEKKKHFEKEMAGFERLFKAYLTTKHQTIDWSLISPPKEDMIIPLRDLPRSDRAKDLAAKLCILKLNGGLGTTMGCVGPKSAIEVREGSSFLDLNVKQIKVRKVFLCFNRPYLRFRSLFHPNWTSFCTLSKASR
jgi:UTP--glucose-1-phosphate uridylyltransferase